MAVPLPAGIDRHAITNRLLRATEFAPFTSFRIKRGQLHAGEVVGCIQIGHIRLNILPKVDTGELDRDADFLMNILRAAGYLSRSYIRSAQVRASSKDPLEVMISEVAAEMASAMRGGIPKRYEERNEDSIALRGRIDFSRLSSRLPGRMTLPVRFAVLGTDNALARYIKWISSTLFRLTRSSANRQVFNNVLGQMVGIEGKAPSAAQLDSLQLSRFEVHWTKSIAIGRLLLLGQFPDPTFTGKTDAFSVLFPLQHLFERTMRQILEKTMHGSGFQVRHRTESLFLLHESESHDGILRLKPDYVFHHGANTPVVADAKWKRLSQAVRAHGVERDDLYQISAYLSRYEARDAIIFVPRANWMTPGWAKWYGVPSSDRRIHLVGVDIEGLVSTDKKVNSNALAILRDCLDAILCRKETAE